jgi:hypothetical protein
MKNYLILFSIFFVAFVIRFYNFSDRFTFGPEQARSLMVSSNYIQDKPSLLGQEYFRSNSFGHKLYTSAIFNYSLVPLLLVTNYDPFLLTIYFGLLNIFTGIVIYLLTKKMISNEAAYGATILFLFNSYMIYHSMFIWVLNYLPLLGILNLYLLWKLKNKNYKSADIFWIGIISGIGFGLEYLYILAVLISLYIVIKYTKNKINSILILILGSVVGDFTQVLFDLRHNFYHLSSLWRYALDTFSGKSDAGFVYYHFLEFWPVAMVIVSFLIFKKYKLNKFLVYLLFALYIFFNLSSSLINYSKPVGMVDGLKYKDLLKASNVIADNATDNFNVVTLYDFDTRGYTLRYFVQYVYGKKPQNEINYQNVDEIYALAANNYNFKVNNPWELNVFKAQNVVKLEDIGSGYGLYKLTK